MQPLALPLPPHPAGLRAGAAEALRLALLAAALSALSLAITGFQYGIINNVFHIPYVLRLAALPQFEGDAFYASLRNFTSIAWPLLRLWTEGHDAQQVFLAAHVASRFAAIAALLFLGRVNGVRDWGRAGLLGLACTIALSRQAYSPVGEHGLFIHYFTHSEATWAPIFLALACLQLGRPVAAAAFVGLTFCLNAFVGVWMAGIAAFCLLRSEPAVPRTRLVPAALTLGLACLPVLPWIAGTFDGEGAQVRFSFIEYIRGYHPNHFLIEAAEPGKLARLALQFAAAWMAAGLSAQPRFWRSVLLGCALVFLAGVVLPYVADLRAVFNLHLLRSDGIVVAVGTLLVALAGATLLLHPRDAATRLLGWVLLGSLLVFHPDELLTAFAAAGALAVARHHGMRQFRSAARAADAGEPRPLPALLPAGALVLLLMASVLLNASAPPWAPSVASQLLLLALGTALALHPSLRPALQPVRVVAPSGAVLLAAPLLLAAVHAAFAANWRLAALERQSRAAAPWVELTEWIRDRGLEGPFLVPLGREADNFQLMAEQTVWVNWKQGAAVMWSPAFHAQWQRRMDEVKPLTGGAEILAYAEAQAIAHVILKRSQGGCAGAYRERLSNERYVLCSLEGAPPPRRKRLPGLPADSRTEGVERRQPPRRGAPQSSSPLLPSFFPYRCDSASPRGRPASPSGSVGRRRPSASATLHQRSQPSTASISSAPSSTAEAALRA